MAIPVTKKQRLSYRVLLVEDNPPMADVTAEFMRNDGLEVQCAATGREAIEMAATFQPEIVVCDLNLPDMSGLDVARAMRAISTAKDAVIAMHTAMNKSDLRMFAGQHMDVFVNLFLSKPISPEKLDALITAVQSHSHKVLII